MSKRSSQAARRRSRTFGLNHLMYAIFWIAVLFLLVRDSVQRGYWVFLVVFGLTVAPVLAIFVLIVGLARRHATQQEGLLAMLSVAAENQLPLAPGLEALAEVSGGGFRQRCYALAYLLESGMPLPQALQHVPGLLTRPATLLACVGWTHGDLARGLRLAREAQDVRKAYRTSVLSKLGYLAAMLIATQVICGFLLYFIAPKFRAIFADFGVALPDLTHWVFVGGDLVLGSYLLPLLVLAELAIACLLPASYFGLIPWQPMGGAWFFRRRTTSLLLRALAIGAQSGQPLTRTLRVILEFEPRPRIRGKISHALAATEHGRPWTDALAAEGLIYRTDRAVLDAAQRAGNLGWALVAQAESNERRLAYRLNALSQLVLPLVVVLMGLLVLALAAGYFLPLISLIQELAE